MLNHSNPWGLITAQQTLQCGRPTGEHRGPIPVP